MAPGRQPAVPDHGPCPGQVDHGQLAEGVDPAAHRLFIGDYIYPTTLYAFLPGSSLSTYHVTAQRLLADLPADTILWGAHCCRAGEGVAAPWLGMSDLRDMDRAVEAARAGTVTSTGFYPRRFPVSRQMTLATGFAWNNR